MEMDMDYERPLRILILAAEIVPFAKVGGLADVVGALPKALQELGHDVRLVMPRYGQVSPERFQLTTALDAVPVNMGHYQEQVRVLQGSIGQGVPVYMIDAPRYFDRENIYGYTDDGERFILFCRSALETVRTLDWSPDIIHCNDWQTGIVPNWMHIVYHDDPFFADAATVYTIHNLAYQGIFGYRILEVAGVATGGFLYPQIVELANVVDIMGRGILFADAITTVSERYAQEILTPTFGEKLDPLLRSRRDHLFGILNGIDYQEMNPATDRYIHTQFDCASLDKRAANKRALQERAHLPVRSDVPLIGMISRLADQKGFDLIAQIAQPLLAQGIQLVVLGIGDQHYHEIFQNLAARYPEQVVRPRPVDRHALRQCPHRAQRRRPGRYRSTVRSQHRRGQWLHLRQLRSLGTIRRNRARPGSLPLQGYLAHVTTTRHECRPFLACLRRALRRCLPQRHQVSQKR